jgi:NADH-quinone oxidoreductase subunit E
MFSPENQAKFDEIVKRYPVKRSALLPALHLLQEQYGWLDTPQIEFAGRLLDLTPAQVHDTATYYSMYRFKPFGKTHIEVCTNLSCALAGADELIESTCRKLGVREFEMTADGKFTVNRVECLAACGGRTAPRSRSTSRAAATRS